MRRIFTWGIATSTTIEDGTITYPMLLGTFLAQEDITIIGFEINLHPPVSIIATDRIGNDGSVAWEAELTPQGGFMMEGGLGICAAIEVWNTTPAAVDYELAHKIVMFPEGFGVTVREEGVINLMFNGSNDTAVDVRVTVDARLYYVKGIR